MKEKKIIELIDSVRPYLVNDGGDIEFVKYEDNIVYVKIHGACAECNLLDVTLHENIEMLIKDEFPDVKEVINIS